jgi:hypothetical protein
MTMMMRSQSSRLKAEKKQLKYESVLNGEKNRRRGRCNNPTAKEEVISGSNSALVPQYRGDTRTQYKRNF